MHEWLYSFYHRTFKHGCVFINVLQVDDELEIKAYYAGHVLGAAMFHMRVGTESLVYTVSITTQYQKIRIFCPWTYV